jgi:hypothetical protein
MPKVAASMGEEGVIANKQKQPSSQEHTHQGAKYDTPIERSLWLTHCCVDSFVCFVNFIMPNQTRNLWKFLRFLLRIPHSEIRIWY